MTTAQTIPAGPEAITPEWLTQTLRAGGHIGDATVTRVSFEPIGQGAGILCRLARLTIDYDRTSADTPRTLVAKMPTLEPQTRQMVGMFRFYEREVCFYQEIASEVALPTARCYYGAFEPASGDFILLIEDLASARLGDQLRGASLDEAELIVSELAKLHAAWWNSPRLTQLAWMPDASSETNMAGLSLYPMAWGPFLERFGNKLSDKMLKTGERLPSAFAAILQRFSDGPVTICHGDFRLDNLFFGSRPGQPPLAAIDWQISIKGRGMYDVGYFTSQSLGIELRRTHEMDLLRRYHRLLTEYGVKDYSFEQAQSDYRWTLLFCFAYPVMGGGLGDLSNERGYALGKTMMERSAAAITDWDAGALLDE